MKKKLIDENGKLFGAVSIIDILVIIVALALVGACYMRFFAKDATSKTAVNDSFTFRVKVSGIREANANSFKIGDKVFDKVNNTYLGTVTDVSISDSMADSPLSDGERTYAEIENRFDIILTLNASGLISNGRYYASRTFEINVNDSIDIYTKYSSVNATVWSLEK